MKMKMKTKKIAGLLAVALFLPLAAVTADIKYPTVENKSWKVGETLTYKMKYGIFKAGTAQYKVSEGPTMNGRTTVKFTSSMKSGKWFFYKIDDLMTSYSDAESLVTYKYVKKQREGDYSNDEFTTYDHATAKALRYDDDVKHEPMKFTQFAKDVLGAVYYVRTLPLSTDKTISFPVHDARRDYTMDVKIKKREKVTVPTGTYNTIVVEPHMYNAQGPLEKGQMTLWLTDDERRIPVKLKIHIGFGSVEGELISEKGTLQPE